MEKSKRTEDKTADEVTRQLPIMYVKWEDLIVQHLLKELKHPICWQDKWGQIASLK